MKLSKSEAGKLGAEASKKTAHKQKEERELAYNLNPNNCRFCLNALTYVSRKNKFCNSSCSASFNNLLRTKKIRSGEVVSGKKRTRTPITWKCLFCNKEQITAAWRTGKYCSLKCQHDYQYKIKINDWISGNIKPGKGAIKRYLTEKFGYKCTVCGIYEYNNKHITLEIEHKDGNSENNLLENLCFLCPNCHSQTPTYKSKNRGKGRHSRRQRYQEGKSY